MIIQSPATGWRSTRYWTWGRRQITCWFSRSCILRDITKKAVHTILTFGMPVWIHTESIDCILHGTERSEERQVALLTQGVRECGCCGGKSGQWGGRRQTRKQVNFLLQFLHTIFIQSFFPTAVFVSALICLTVTFREKAQTKPNPQQMGAEKSGLDPPLKRKLSVNLCNGTWLQHGMIKIPHNDSL